MALLRAREAVMGRFRPTLREYDLTEQQWRVLRALSSAPGPLRPSEIAQLTFISMPSLSRLLRTLEARRIIRRAADAADLRSAQLSMTGSGRALVAAIAPSSEASYSDIARQVGDTDLEELYRLLDKLAERLGTSPGAGRPAERD